MSAGRRLLYHLVPPAVWARTENPLYRAASLETEGFIHCSYREQVAWVANQLYAAEPELMLLTIDPNRLISPVRDEDPGTGELFPHVYGPIPAAAVVAIDRMSRDPEGRWQLPESVR